jgi:putative copper export protein
MTVALTIHLLAAAAWGGGLVFLGVAAGVARRTIPDRERVGFFRSLGRRFLLVSAVAAAALALTGAILADDRLGGVDRIGRGHDGGIVLAKTILFCAALFLAAVHSFVLGPRTRSFRQRLLDGEDDAALRRGLARTAAASGIASLAMLAATVAIFALAASLG